MGIDFGDYWGSGTILNRAYEKYGKDAFKREIVDYASSKEELNFMECFYIQHFNSMKPNGYNIASGGRGGFTGIATEETRKKISQALKGRIRSEEHRKHLSEAHKGLQVRKHTEEEKKKISLAHMGIEPWNKGKRKKVIQYTMDGEYVRTWDSLDEASLHGYNKSKISECINGHRKHHRHYLWGYIDGKQ